jgi:glucose-1-phosphate thymidylyltransferase
MKGVICAGGSGSRLYPLTEVTNKHLLAVYDKPMIFYPLLTLLEAGVKEIMIVCSNEHSGPFQKLLGSGKKFGADISFKVQDEAGGIAEALGLCRTFVSNDNVAVILGDNIFEDNFEEDFKNFRKGAKLFLKQVADPHRFGVPELDGKKIIDIQEKPTAPKSDFAITGLYLYDNSVFEVIDGLSYSNRNELEITDVNNHFVKDGLAEACYLSGDWTDAGTFESLYLANQYARKISLSKSKVIRKHNSIYRDLSKNHLSEVLIKENC